MKAAIFDFGGVLTTNLWEALTTFCRREGLADNALRDLITADPEGIAVYDALERGVISQRKFEVWVAGRLGVASQDLLAKMGQGLKPEAVMLDVMATLRAADIRIGVLSNSWGYGPYDPYAPWNLESRADVLVYSHRVGMRKPAPELYTLVAEKLTVHERECAFIDDIAANLVPARRLGMATIHHVKPGSSSTQLRRLFSLAISTAQASTRGRPPAAR